MEHSLGAWEDSGNLGNGNAYAGNNPWSNLDPFGLMKGDFSRGHQPDRKRTAGSLNNKGFGLVKLGSDENTPTAIDVLDETTVRFRPSRITTKPSVTGSQTARVVGPSGEEIWPNEYGRIKVRFYWGLFSAEVSDEDNGATCGVGHTFSFLRFKPRSTIPHKVSLLDCEGNASIQYIRSGAQLKHDDISGFSASYYSSPGERINRPDFGAGLRRIPKHNPEWTTSRGAGQYRETDFSFISRLMEQEGIWYYTRVPERLRHKNRAFIPEIDDEVLISKKLFVGGLNW